MPRATWAQNNFNAGEWTPRVLGRADLSKYKNALATCLNYMPTIQGGITRRPGTRYVAEVKNSADAVRLQAFEFSTTQAYVLEFGPSYVRFYTNEGQLLNLGSPYEVATPYAAADLMSLKFTQSADVLYITHNNYAPRKLNRLGATNWTLTTISFLDGPYLNVNGTATTMTASGGTGSVTVTASAVTGINSDTGFQTTDVGRLIRIKSGTNWGWGTITARTSTTQVTVSITSAVGTTATTDWQLGLYSSTTGYPACVTFHEDRLFFAGPTNYPHRVDGSKSSDYENFAPTDPDGTVPADCAIAISLNANQVNAVRWLMTDERGLLAGTAGGEWLIRASSLQDAMSPTNVQAKQPTVYGSNTVAPLKIDKSTLFLQRNGRKVREMSYVYMSDGFEAADVSAVSEHIFISPGTQMAAQLSPQQYLWAVKADGTLASCTFDKHQEVVGWARHTLGGYYNSGNTQAPKVESIAVIPSPDGTRDTVWVVVNRYINGATHRYVEYMTKLWENGDTLADAVYLDSSAVYSGAPTTTVSGLTWLIGQTVSVLADGSVHPDCVVNGSGVITLSRSASKVQVGLGYVSDGQTLRIEAGGGDGTAQGKLKRIHRVIFRFFQSVGLSVLPNAYGVPLAPEPFRSSADLMDSPVGLFTGDKRWAWEGTYETEGQVFWRQDQPLPSNIEALVVQLETQDGG